MQIRRSNCDLRISLAKFQLSIYSVLKLFSDYFNIGGNRNIIFIDDHWWCNLSAYLTKSNKLSKLSVILKRKAGKL